MKNIRLEIGKTYKIRNGKTVLIEDGLPPIDEKHIGWNGIYFGKIEGSGIFERFLWTGEHWNYLSQFSAFGYKEFNNHELDIIEIV